MQTETYKRIAIKHKHFVQEMNTVWESYETINFYAERLHVLLREGRIETPVILKIKSDSTAKLRKIAKDNAYGTLTHIKDKKNPRVSLIEIALIFEHYISSVIELVYQEFPKKAFPASEKYEGEEKVIDIILSSDDKQEIINRLIEEKLRKLFYGNIADIFIKDKARMELKDTFTNEYGRKLVAMMLEIFARRNIHIHNGGKVDSKYIRETRQNADYFNKVLAIDQNYLHESTNVLIQIATMFTCAIMKNIYKVEPQSKALKRIYWKNNIANNA